MAWATFRRICTPKSHQSHMFVKKHHKADICDFPSLSRMRSTLLDAARHQLDMWQSGCSPLLAAARHQLDVKFHKKCTFGSNGAKSTQCAKNLSKSCYSTRFCKLDVETRPKALKEKGLCSLGCKSLAFWLNCFPFRCCHHWARNSTP